MAEADGAACAGWGGEVHDHGFEFEGCSAAASRWSANEVFGRAAHASEKVVSKIRLALERSKAGARRRRRWGSVGTSIM